MAGSDESPSNVIPIDSGSHQRQVRALRDELVLSHLSLAEGIARRIHSSLPPSFDLDDLIGTANIGLLNAATKFRPDEHGGAPFAAYARLVIRGTVIESVRGRPYTENTRPSIDMPEVSDIAPPELARQAPGSSAEERAERRAAIKQVICAATYLPKRQRAVLSEHYGTEELNLRETAEKLGISTQMAKEAHVAAIGELRARLTGGAVKRRRVA